MNLGDLLDRGAIAPRVSAANKRQALSVIAEIAARSFGLKAPEVFDALLEREAAGSTGVGHGVAIPHARIPGMERLRGVFVRLEQPVDFDAVDDKPVDLLFALFGPRAGGSEHLRALARASRLLRQAELREQLRKASGPDAIRALLVAETSRSAA
ncbi:MAG TPA: PTS IIA-like nitrogen regulatory protein PtsN [Caulobacteraceae bacterium]|nr:PTS IIA-like nitrogen regulatory protein PtsN [Caulobacteraceae bacterium]